MIRSFLLVYCVILGTVGCNSGRDATSERQALLETDRAWANAAASGDVKRLTEFWADDATNYFPGAPVARGKQAIGELVQRNRSQPGFSLAWEPAEAVVAASGDLGYTSGTFELSVNDADGNPAIRRGHYVCIWKKQADGSWKCIVESSIFGPSSNQ